MDWDLLDVKTENENISVLLVRVLFESTESVI